MVDDAIVGFTVDVDEFRDTAVPSRYFNDFGGQITQTGIETGCDFEFSARQTIRFVLVVIFFRMESNVLSFEALPIRKYNAYGQFVP